MPSKYVKRISIFQVAKEEDIDTILSEYKVMRATAEKDGAPYIVSNEASRVLNATEERSQGYTIVSLTTFKSLADVEYYDKQCAAHAKLRAIIAARRTGAATLHFESDL